MKIYVVARSVNTNRPGCMHIVDLEERSIITRCGYDLTGTSRDYTDIPLMSILCKTCERTVE